MTPRPYRSTGFREVMAVALAASKRDLSGFVAGDTSAFFGGPEVKGLERRMSSFFGSDFSVAFNSWTSGLVACAGAVGLSGDDEYIVPAWTMSASAFCGTPWGARPVFVDIDPATYVPSIEQIESKVTNKTKAVIHVDIFGRAHDIGPLMDFCRPKGIKVISDAAQAPAATVSGKFAGTNADLGGISLNRHKHFQSGEGGVAFTNSPEIAQRMQKIRNHGENNIDLFPGTDVTPGYNFRMTELEAAVARVQLQKLRSLVESRQKVAQRFITNLKASKALLVPEFEGERNSYYVLPMQLDGISESQREMLVSKVRALGLPIMFGYQALHRLPYFKQNFGFTSLPITERLHDHSFIGINTCARRFGNSYVDEISERLSHILSQL